MLTRRPGPRPPGSLALGTAVLLGALRVLADAPAAPEFSADLVVRNAAGVPSAPGRLYVSGQRVRIESGAAAAGFFLVDARAGTALFVHPGEQLFTEAGRSSPLTQVFVPVDPAAPCAAWRSAAERAAGTLPRWSCEALARASYRVTSGTGQPSERWVDAALGFAVKVRAGDGSTVTLEHLERGAQPAQLFTVPAGYRRLDARALIERMRHSDVWAGRD